MKLICLFLYFFIGSSLFSEVVINEILYDPEGSDSGYEWIELYNSGSENVNLFGWKIEKGGSEFAECFTFENSFIIHPHDFILIGEEFVQNADLQTDLAFQNGGSATDGVRIVSPNGYTDTILYDSPNTNNLPDDINEVGADFAPDVTQGHSLARISDGVDTNSSQDWFDCSNPTPKSRNIAPVDLAVKRFYYEQSGNNITLFTVIQNLSTIDVDNFVADMKIFMDQEVIFKKEIAYIPPNDSVIFTYNTGEINAGYHLFKSNLNIMQDNNLENNSKQISLLVGASPIILNELMIKPENDDNEWVEVFNRNNVDMCVDNIYIEDRSGGKIELFGSISDYLVICKNKELFSKSFPMADTSKVIQSSVWTSLNNTTENLYLKDYYGTLFDSLYYNAYHLNQNISYERVNPYSDINIQWKECINENGGTPTFPNSNLLPNNNLSLRFIGIANEGENLKHRLKIFNNGISNIRETEIKCFIKKNDGEFSQIFQDNITFQDTIYYEFDTDVYREGYYSFKYKISDDDNLSDNIAYGFYNDNSLPFVINEIMYNPAEGEPEWLEICKNYQISELDSFYLKSGDDIYPLLMPDSEYFLITSNDEDAMQLKNEYNLQNLPLVGLSSLTNSGKLLELYDKNMNLIESFEYKPEWNNKQKGVSIERVNPNLNADEGNFGPCLNFSTPEMQNSLFVQVLPSNNRLTFSPNPFSPYKSEHTIIEYKLNTPINKVTVKIFDLKGREIRKIVKNALSASKGSIVWDGRDSGGKIIPIGVYILYFKAIGTNNNRLYENSKTIVIKK